MTWWEAVVSGAPAGGLVGYLSSVFAAGPVARRQHRARQAVEAQDAIDELARDYINDLKRGRPDAQKAERGKFALDYASLRGQAEFAEKIIKHTRNLKPHARKTTLQKLRELVGEDTVVAAELGIEPAGPRLSIGTDPVAGGDRRFQNVEQHILMDYHDGSGCVEKTRVHCERDHYPQVQREYGKLGVLWLTKQHPHYQHFEQRYTDAIDCLERLIRSL